MLDRHRAFHCPPSRALPPGAPAPSRARPIATLAALCGALLLAAAPGSQAAAASAAATQSNPEVRVTTSMGSFIIELRPNRAPLTVANFLRYVKNGFYTNTLFHRVVSNFIIQGGGHEATAPYALKPSYPAIDNESGNGLENKRGAVGLARAAGPDTGNSQFYVNLVDNPELDPLPTRWGYAVFGKVIEGMDVVDRIGVVPTGAFGPFKSDAPLTPVVIESIQLIGGSGASPQSAPAPSSGSTPTVAPSSAPPSGAPSAPPSTAPSAPPSGAPSAPPSAAPSPPATSVAPPPGE